MILVDQLSVWLDQQDRPAAEQMAVDESLFNSTKETNIAWLRFYQWQTPCVTIGYFGKRPTHLPHPIIIRRMTGGGLVNHGNDLTYCLTLPSNCAGGRHLNTAQRYKAIHQNLALALSKSNIPVEIVDKNSTQLDQACFSNPVRWDLINPSTKEKIVGGSQRNSRGTIIHQGSIQMKLIDFPSQNWIHSFAKSLAKTTFTIETAPTFTLDIDDLSKKYEHLDWNNY